MTFDMPGKSANVLTDEVWVDLSRALDRLESKPPAGVILVSAKPTIYVAGADLVKISNTLDWSDDEIIRFCEEGRAIMSRFSRLLSVSVAAVHGVCVGGGMELTLWCDHRIASDDRKTLFGLPEVKLGLVPGWAGTVRLPRLIGLQEAIDLVTTGNLIDAKRAKELGIVTCVGPQSEMIDRAVQIINDELASRAFLKKRQAMLGAVTDMPHDLDALRQRFQQQIDSNREIDSSAPSIVLQHMIDTAGVDQQAACHNESLAMAKVYGSIENQGLLHYFFLDERSKKVRSDYGEVQPPRIERIGIIGAGLMGCQIAKLALTAGYQVTLFDADQNKLHREFAALATGKNGQNIRVADSFKTFADADLVIEAIVEKLTIKRQLFEQLCQVVGPEIFLATNTSTIPVSDIATAVPNPARLVGLHFCCPVEPLRLVEVIRGQQSSQTIVNVAIDVVRAMRKTPIVVGDHPGFVVNRLLCPVFNQALEMLTHGIPLSQMDASFREFGFAAGPLEMIDFIGVDTIMYAGETFLRTLPELVSLNPILPALVKRGRLGRKSNLGFYRYESFDSVARIDRELDPILDRYQKEPLSLDNDQILDRLLEPMIAAGRAVLADGVVDDSRDVDLCSVLGTTFPAVRGGLLHWADELRRAGS